MKVLFIGGTGLISTAVSELAVKQGIDLYLVNRGNHMEFVPEGAKVLKGDINNASEMEALLQGRYFDAVVDWIVFDAPAMERDIHLFAGKTDQYILISSCATYQRPITHYIVNESTVQNNPGWDYAVNKLRCEEILLRAYREQHFPMTIVRPSHTYGKTAIPFAINSWDAPWTLCSRLLKGKKIIVPGDGTSLWTLTHNTDFAKAFVGLLGNTQAVGQTFHITSDEVKTWDQYVKVIGQALGVEPKIIHIASDLIGTFIPDVKAGLLCDLCHSYVVDNTKIKRFVPVYVATTNFEKGIRESIAYFMAHPDKMKIDEALDSRMDRLIETYEGFVDGLMDMK